MMNREPIRTRRNQYRGINAHLHSYWQLEGGWNNFHAPHIGDLAGLMRLKLLPMGYTVSIEESVQIRRNAGGKPYRAIAIREGYRLLAWVELLAPDMANDPFRRKIYATRRAVLVRHGAVYIELDYLHTLTPTFSVLADYSDIYNRDPEANPYRIIEINPMDENGEGDTYVHELAVDDPVPAVRIRLTQGNALRFDFGKAYNRTFTTMCYGLELVDYARPPVHIHRYSPRDQASIYNRLVTVLEADAVVREHDAPLPVERLPLDKARARYEQLRQK